MLLALVLCAAPDRAPLTATRFEALAYSADEQRVALEVFHAAPPECDPSRDAGPADLPHSVVVFEGTRPVATFPIGGNDEGCTPPAEARRRLDAVKARLAAMGLSAPTVPPTLLTPLFQYADRQVERRVIPPDAGDPFGYANATAEDVSTWTEWWSTRLRWDLPLTLAVHLTAHDERRLEGQAQLGIGEGRESSGRDVALPQLSCPDPTPCRLAFEAHPLIVAPSGQTALVAIMAATRSTRNASSVLAALERVTMPPPNPLGQALSEATLVEPLAFSADERRVALRVFHGEAGGEHEPCPGYVDAKGKEFDGALSLVVFEHGKTIAAFPIQDAQCTPPREARKRLAAAKIAIAGLGIDLGGPKPPAWLPLASSTPRTTSPLEVKYVHPNGEEEVETHDVSTWSTTWAVTPSEGVNLRLTIDSTRDQGGTFTVSGTAHLTLERPGKTRVIRSQPLDSGGGTGAMGGDYAHAPQPFIFSPSRRVAIVIVSGEFTSGRGRSSKTQFVETIDLAAP
jgi:hypothetical protein